MGNLTTYGFSGLIGKLDSISERLKIQLTGAVVESADNIRNNAIMNAPSDVGTLRGSIQKANVSFDNTIAYRVYSDLSYAPYMEFGTGGKVDTRGYEEFAGQFKGKSGGTMQEFIEALTLWVERKGIVGTYSIKTRKRTGKAAIQNTQNRQAAWAIAISILKNGLRPQPFLLPAFENEQLNFLNNIKTVLNNAKS